MVADAALGGATAEVVLDAIAGEYLDAPVIHVDREVDGQLATWLAQNAAQARVEVEPLGGEVELPLGDLPRVDRGGGVLRCHEARILRIQARRTSATWLLSRLPDDPTARDSGPGFSRGGAAMLELRPSIAVPGEARHGPGGTRFGGSDGTPCGRTGSGPDACDGR